MVPTVAFLVCAATLLYILFGYPLLLMLLARRRPRPIQREFRLRSVTVLLAVRNGEPWIGAKLRSILALDYPRALLEIIVISDGSDDATERIANGFASGITVIRVPRGGKARALNAGIARAGGEILFFTDVRQPLAPDSLRRLVACFADPSVGVVSGELVLADEPGVEKRNVGLYWQYEKWIRKNLSRVDSILGATGCIYAMRRSLARSCPPEALLDDVYFPLAAFFAGYRAVLEEGAFAYDDPAPLRHEFVRKVRTQAGVLQLLRYYPALLSFSNRMLMHFVSHKLGRLALPYLLLGIAISSFGLPSPWRTPVLALQAFVYALALADVWIVGGPAKRITSPLRTFVTLVGAAFLAPAVFFVPPSSFWAPVPAPSAVPDEPVPAAPRARGTAAGK